jgi:hypothetical protein
MGNNSSRHRGDIKAWRAITGDSRSAAVHALHAVGPLVPLLRSLAEVIADVEAFAVHYPLHDDEARAHDALVLGGRVGDQAERILTVARAHGGDRTVRIWDGYRAYAALTGGLTACQPGRTLDAPPWAEPIPKHGAGWWYWHSPDEETGAAFPVARAARKRRRAEIAAGRDALGRPPLPRDVPAAPRPNPPGTDTLALAELMASLARVRTGLRHLHLDDLGHALFWQADRWMSLARSLRGRAAGEQDIHWVPRPDGHRRYVVCFVRGRAVAHAELGGAWTAEMPEAVMFWGDPDQQDSWIGATDAATDALEARRQEILQGRGILAARGVIPAVVITDYMTKQAAATA